MSKRVCSSFNFLFSNENDVEVQGRRQGVRRVELTASNLSKHDAESRRRAELNSKISPHHLQHISPRYTPIQSDRNLPSPNEKVEMLLSPRTPSRPRIHAADWKLNGVGLCCVKTAGNIAMSAGSILLIRPDKAPETHSIPNGSIALLWRQTPLRDVLLVKRQAKVKAKGAQANASPSDKIQNDKIQKQGSVQSGISDGLMSDLQAQLASFWGGVSTNEALAGSETVDKVISSSSMAAAIDRRKKENSHESLVSKLHDEQQRLISELEEEKKRDKHRSTVKAVCGLDDFDLYVPPSCTAPSHPHPEGCDPTNKKICCLVSGGKDSILTVHMAHAMGYEIACLATFVPPKSTKNDEADSYMFQSVGTSNVEHIAASMGVPLLVRQLVGGSVSTESNEYVATHGDEVEDMFHTLYFAMEYFGVRFASAGAVFSDYQRMRVESVCTRLGLVSVAPLWRWPQEEVLKMVQAMSMEAILVKVASMGIDAESLGKTTTECLPLFKKLHKQFGFHIAGEGGEYETFVMDAPLYRHPLKLLHKRLVADKSMGVYHLADVSVCSNQMMPSTEQIQDESPAVARETMQRTKISRRDSNAVHVKLFDQFLVNVYPESLLDPWDQGHMGTCEGASRFETFIEVANAKIDTHEGPWEDFDSRKVTREQIVVTDAYDVSSIPQLLAGNQMDHMMLHDYLCADASVQARKLFRAIIVHLGKRIMGCRTLRHVTHVDLQLRDMNDFAAVNKEYIQVFPAIQPPTRCCVGACLPAGIKLRIRLTLCAPPEKVVTFNDIGVENVLLRNRIQCQQPAPDRHRDVLHVQSMSTWAMACIGPYSQSHAVNCLELTNQKEVESAIAANKVWHEKQNLHCPQVEEQKNEEPENDNQSNVEKVGSESNLDEDVADVGAEKPSETENENEHESKKEKQDGNAPDVAAVDVPENEIPEPEIPVCLFKQRRHVTTAGVLGLIPHDLSLPPRRDPDEGICIDDVECEIDLMLRSLTQVVHINNVLLEDVACAKVWLSAMLPLCERGPALQLLQDKLEEIGVRPEAVICPVTVPVLPKNALIEVQFFCRQGIFDNVDDSLHFESKKSSISEIGVSSTDFVPKTPGQALYYHRQFHLAEFPVAFTELCSCMGNDNFALTMYFNEESENLSEEILLHVFEQMKKRKTFENVSVEIFPTVHCGPGVAFFALSTRFEQPIRFDPPEVVRPDCQRANTGQSFATRQSSVESCNEHF